MIVRDIHAQLLTHLSSSSNDAMSSSSWLMIGMLGVGPDGVVVGDAVGCLGGAVTVSGGVVGGSFNNTSRSREIASSCAEGAVDGMSLIAFFNYRVALTILSVGLSWGTATAWCTNLSVSVMRFAAVLFMMTV